MTEKKFKTPLYGHSFSVIIYDNDQELKDRFPDHEFEMPGESFDGGLLDHNEDMFLVFSCEKNGFPSPGIIAHESLHLVNKIFNDIGHFPSRYNDEPEAYLIGWIVNRVHEVVLGAMMTDKKAEENLKAAWPLSDDNIVTPCSDDDVKAGRIPSEEEHAKRLSEENEKRLGNILNAFNLGIEPILDQDESRKKYPIQKIRSLDMVMVRLFQDMARQGIKLSEKTKVEMAAAIVKSLPNQKDD